MPMFSIQQAINVRKYSDLILQFSTMELKEHLAFCTEEIISYLEGCLGFFSEVLNKNETKKNTNKHESSVCRVRKERYKQIQEEVFQWIWPCQSPLFRLSQQRFLWNSTLTSVGLWPELNFDLKHFDRNFSVQGGIKFTKTRKYKEADLELKGVKHGCQQSLWGWTTGLRPGSSFAGCVTLGNFQIHKLG